MKTTRPQRIDVSQHATEARAIVARYVKRIAAKPKTGYIGGCAEMPTVVGGGETEEACLADLNRALVGAAAIMLARGGRPPVPLADRDHAVTEQINVRVTASEKRAIIALAESADPAMSISELVRRFIRVQLAAGAGARTET